MTASGYRLDRLAELEEERRFLLRSLTDLEREHDAGDVDDLDYHTLKDGYTVRAATVLRQIDEGKGGLAERPPRRWGRVAVVTATVVAGSIGVGVILAGAWGERSSGQEITGMTPATNRASCSTNARDALATGDFELANALFARVIDMERERGTDNAEALAYFGWTLALLTRVDPEAPDAAERLDAARLALAAIDRDRAGLRRPAVLPGDHRVPVPRRCRGGAAVRRGVRGEQSSRGRRIARRQFRRRDPHRRRLLTPTR